MSRTTLSFLGIISAILLLIINVNRIFHKIEIKFNNRILTEATVIKIDSNDHIGLNYFYKVKYKVHNKSYTDTILTHQLDYEIAEKVDVLLPPNNPHEIERISYSDLFIFTVPLELLGFLLLISGSSWLIFHYFASRKQIQ